MHVEGVGSHRLTPSPDDSRARQPCSSDTADSPSRRFPPPSRRSRWRSRSPRLPRDRSLTRLRRTKRRNTSERIHPFPGRNRPRARRSHDAEQRLLRPARDVRQLHAEAVARGRPTRRRLMDNSARSCGATGWRSTRCRAVDHDIPPGVQPDMTEHGFERDDWPAIQRARLRRRHPRARDADLARRQVERLHRVIERLYGYSGQLNDQGQWIYYGRVGGVVVTGNEDGIKHVAMNILYSPPAPRLRHPAAGRLRLDRRGRPGAELRRPGQRRARERVHRAATPPS